MHDPVTPIGCALLNNAASINSGGVASLNGGEPFRFTTLDTLQARGPLWVLSTPDVNFLTEEGRAHPYLRHAGFLGTPVTAIAQELGVSESANAGLAVQRVSEVLTRVYAMVQAFCPGATETQAPSSRQSLVSLLQGAVAPALRHEDMPKDLLEAMPFLFKAPQPMGSPNAHDIAVRIPANRLRLAEMVLGAAVPAGDWHEVDLSEYSTPGMALSWAIGHRAPVLCYVTIRAPLPRVKASAPLMRNLTAGVTRWMALPEVIVLSRLVDMTPKRIFLASDVVSAHASLKIPPPVFSPAACASISAGLFAEAYLHAACASTAQLPGDGGGAIASPQIYSVRAAWLTAMARSHMTREAIALADANFSVIGFGPSHILVSVARRNLRALRRAVASSSLLSYPSGLRAMEEPLAALQESHELIAEGGAA